MALPREIRLAPWLDDDRVAIHADLPAEIVARPTSGMVLTQLAGMYRRHNEGLDEVLSVFPGVLEPLSVATLGPEWALVDSGS